MELKDESKIHKLYTDSKAITITNINVKKSIKIKEVNAKNGTTIKKNLKDKSH